MLSANWDWDFRVRDGASRWASALGSQRGAGAGFRLAVGRGTGDVRSCGGLSGVGLRWAPPRHRRVMDRRRLN